MIHAFNPPLCVEPRSRTRQMAIGVTHLAAVDCPNCLVAVDRHLEIGDLDVEPRPSIETTSEEARLLLDRALAQTNGHLDAVGYWLALAARRREKPLTVADLDGIAGSADWIKQQRFRKTIDRDFTSYWFKHRVEDWFKTVRGEHLYVCNGGFIAAMIGLGHPWQPMSDLRSPNVHFSFSRRRIP